jgi:hypothetical protein
MGVGDSLVMGVKARELGNVFVGDFSPEVAAAIAGM